MHVLLNEDAVEDFDAGLAAIESSMEGAHSLVLALGESAVPEDDRKYTTSKASGPSVVNHDSSSTEISMAAAALEDAHKLSSIAGDKDGADAKGQSSKAGIQAQPAGEAAGPFPNEDLEGPKQVTALSRAAADEEQAPAAEADAKACEAGSEILAPGQPENEKPAPGKAALSSPVAQLETAPVADVPGAEGAVDGLLTEVHADQEQAAQSWPPWDAQEEAPESEREETSASAESAADNAALEVVEAQLDANSVPEEEAVEELAGETQGPVAPQPELSAEPRQEPVEEASKNASVPVEATDDESGRASVSYLSSAQATGFGVGSSMTPEAPADQGRNVADTDAAEAVLEVPADTQEPTSEGRAEDPEVKRAEPFEAAPKAAEAAVDASPVLMATEESPSGGLDVEVVLAAADEQREDSAAAAPVSLAEPRGGAVQKSLVMPPGAESMGDKPADTGAALEFCSEETSEEITGSDPLEAQDVELAEALEQAQRAEDSTATADTEMGGNPPIASGEMGAEGEDAAMQLAEEAARVELEAAVNLGRGFADHHTDTAAEIPSVVEAGSEGGLEDAPGEKTSDGSETLPGNPTQEATPDLSAEPQAVEGLLTDPNTEDAGGQAEDMGKASVPPASSGVETRGQEVQQNSKDEDPEEAWVKPSPKGAAAGATSRQAVTPSLPAGEFEDTQAFAMFLEAIASSQDSRLGSSSLFSAESVDVHGGDPDVSFPVY